MKSVVRAIGVFCLAFATLTAFAGVDNTWDWKGGKRTLKVFYDFDAATADLGDQKLKDTMDAAIKNWNAAKDDTGWTFVTGGTEADHDIRIKYNNKFADSDAAGATTKGFPGNGNASREVTELTITFDREPGFSREHTFPWDTASRNKDSTKNPVSAAMHELSHALRLSHQGGVRSKSLRIADPSRRGVGVGATVDDDVVEVSKSDKEDAKKSSTAAVVTPSAPSGPGTKPDLVVPGFPLNLPVPVLTPDAILSLPDSAFLNNVVTTFSLTSLYSMPLPFNTPAGIDRMVKGMHIDVTGDTEAPIASPQFFSLSIPYGDGSGGEASLIDIADPEYRVIRESDLRPFFYDPVTQSWKAIDPLAYGGSYTLDTADDVALLSLPVDLLYRFPDPNDARTGTFFISLGAASIPEPPSLYIVMLALLAMAVTVARPLPILAGARAA